MKNRRIGMMAAAFAIGLAGSLGTAQVSQSTTAPLSQNQRSTGEIKATSPTKSVRHKSVVAQAGGLDVIYEGGVFGMTPMQYGMKYGNGKSRKGKTNFARLSHNAKVSRRRA